MGFQQGLSGLNASSRSLDVTGNNVANASTVGFKQSRAEFADVYANSLVGAGNTNIGLGTKLSRVTQQFTQGGITTTNNPLDIAINGGGFFRVSNGGTLSYTRNGQFQLNKDGYVVTSEGYKLQGYQATNGVVAPIVTDVRLFNPANSADIPAVATGTSTSTSTFVGVQAGLNLDSREAYPTVAPFSSTNPSSYNRTTAISVYDSLGNAHTYQMYFVKASPGSAAATAAVGAGASAAQASALQGIVNAVLAAGGTANDVTSALAATGGVATGAAAQTAINALALGAGAGQMSTAAVRTAAANAASGFAGPFATAAAATAASTAANAGGTAGQWDVYATMTNPAGATAASTDFSAAGTVKLGTITFNSSGVPTGATTFTQTVTAAQLGSPGINANAMSFKVDFTNSTQFGSGFKVNNLTQDGSTTGSLAGFNVGKDGTIVGRYTNGVSRTLAQVTLDSFRDPQGLQPIGNNQWLETSESGAALNQTPGTDGNHGPLQGAATEDSNVDLTQELVNMIIAQRVYQANAQTIKTQDSILQTIVNLR